MLNDLRADKDIRANYQFWFYSYPSGYPYPYSALILRQELDAIEKRYPLRKPMVLVGHSMGGCIGRTLITDAGTKLWVTAFGKPPEQTVMPAESIDQKSAASYLCPRRTAAATWPATGSAESARCW
jgi:hypothetical protein